VGDHSEGKKVQGKGTQQSRGVKGADINTLVHLRRDRRREKPTNKESGEAVPPQERRGKNNWVKIQSSGENKKSTVTKD